MSGSEHYFKNLHSLIRNSALTYMQQFIWQDFRLTEEFKEAFESYMKKKGYDIEYLDSTAVITSSSTKYIFVPNQWFVIASYTVNVYKELYKYKSYFLKVADYLYKNPASYAKELRDETKETDRQTFMSCAEKILKKENVCSNDEQLQEAVRRLWRFVSDYSWWSGQKTIDRGDFHISVILNMLNLVNVSQGFVADIASAYASDYRLGKLTEDITSFTENADIDRSGGKTPEKSLDPELGSGSRATESIDIEPVIPKPERVRIKISSTGALKEIKYKN